jgi:hypothetical protein
MKRTDAIARVLLEADGPLSPSQIHQGLKGRGREDGPNAVSAALAYLNHRGRVTAVSRGQWTLPDDSEDEWPLEEDVNP